MRRLHSPAFILSASFCGINYSLIKKPQPLPQSHGGSISVPVTLWVPVLVVAIKTNLYRKLKSSLYRLLLLFFKSNGIVLTATHDVYAMRSQLLLGCTYTCFCVPATCHSVLWSGGVGWRIERRSSQVFIRTIFMGWPLLACWLLVQFLVRPFWLLDVFAVSRYCGCCVKCWRQILLSPTPLLFTLENILSTKK